VQSGLSSVIIGKRDHVEVPRAWDGRLAEFDVSSVEAEVDALKERPRFGHRGRKPLSRSTRGLFGRAY